MWSTTGFAINMKEKIAKLGIHLNRRFIHQNQEHMKATKESERESKGKGQKTASQ